jgi:hypothetical protein
MTITFENENDVIVYALEKVISFAKRTQQVFVARCVWWLASIIGLEQGLIIYIDNLRSRENLTKSNQVPTGSKGTLQQERLSQQVHPDRVAQISRTRSVSVTPRDLTEDQRLDRILDIAERVVQDSFRDRSDLPSNRVNPLPTTKTQLKKARKTKHLQEEGRKREVERNKRLLEIRAEVIRHLSKE